MKKLFTLFTGLLLTGLAFAQSANAIASSAGKIKLTTGQKIIIESSSDVEASLAMGMEFNSTSSSTNVLEAKSVNDKNSTVSNTLIKLKTNINMMGQSENYDSENKAGNKGEMAKMFNNSLNNPVDVIVDNANGSAIVDKKKVKKADSDEANMAADMMKMFTDNADDAVAAGAFEIIPAGKTIGTSWADTTKEKNSKTIRTYTLSSVAGNEANIQINVVSNASNKLSFQGMEFEIKTESKTKGEIITDITTGLVQKRTTKSDISGTIPMMGQEMPISATVNSTSTYK